MKVLRDQLTVVFLQALLSGIVFRVVFGSVPCKLRSTAYGAVCVCTATDCDELRNPEPKSERYFMVISSSKRGLRFALTQGVINNTESVFVSDYVKSRRSSRRKRQAKTQSQEVEINFDSAAISVDSNRRFFHLITAPRENKFTDPQQIVVHVNRTNVFQKILGFGGAFTGSVSHIIQQLEQPLQDQIYKSYFHRDGIAYNLLRMSIGGCDFDLQPWAYNELPQNDKNLSNFTQLDSRDEMKVQQLQRMKQMAELDKIHIMASAWSPPRWMKTNNEWTGISELKPEYYKTWADYHLRFIELMAAKNMPIWAISTGNEPLNGALFWFFVHFMSLGWSPHNQAIWLAEHLGPTLRKSKHNIQIYGNDEQRYTYPTWFEAMNRSRPGVLEYLDGLAVHWYWDEMINPSLLDAANRKMPSKPILNTESCIGDKPWETHGPELGSWERGEKYMRSYMQDFNHHVNGWIDWNLVLNENGGPNYVSNHVDAPIIVNTTNGKEFYKQPMFYAIGHFSKFLPNGSYRIESTINSTHLDVLAFQRPDKSIAVILFNGGGTAMDVLLDDSERGKMTINIPARSMHTIIYN